MSNNVISVSVDGKAAEQVFRHNSTGQVVDLFSLYIRGGHSVTVTYKMVYKSDRYGNVNLGGVALSSVNYEMPPEVLTQKNSPVSVNLTEEGSIDWVYWRGASSAWLASPTINVARKDIPTPIIELKRVNEAHLIRTQDEGAVRISWTDGQAPAQSGVREVSGLVSRNSAGTQEVANGGFEISVPAADVARTLSFVTSGVYQARVDINAYFNGSSTAAATTYIQHGTVAVGTAGMGNRLHTLEIPANYSARVHLNFVLKTNNNGDLKLGPVMLKESDADLTHEARLSALAEKVAERLDLGELVAGQQEFVLPQLEGELAYAEWLLEEDNPTDAELYEAYLRLGAANDMAVIQKKSELDGDGSASDPYQIGNEAELIYAAQRMNTIATEHAKHYILTANIALTNNFPMINTFSGVLDGKGYKITGLVINVTEQTNVGFIRTNNGTIKNLAIEDAVVTSTGATGTANTGILTGQNSGSSALISGCKITGEVTTAHSGGSSGEMRGAGIAGEQNGGATIEDCFFSGTVDADGSNRTVMAGGIVGYADQGTAVISRCIAMGDLYAKTTVADQNQVAAFIAAYQNSNSTSNCVAYDGTIYYTVALQSGNSGRDIGAIYGNTGSVVHHGSNIAYDNIKMQQIGSSTEAANITTKPNQTNVNNITTKTKGELQEQETYENINWDFDDVWIMYYDAEKDVSYPVPQSIEHAKQPPQITKIRITAE